jgi:heme-degrading monooxygenase HmoA
MSEQQEGQPYTSGNWLVKEGEVDAFIAEWSAFTEWSLEDASGAESFVLIQDSGDPRRFLSFGAWADPESVTAWREGDEFRERLGRCRALCEEFEAHDYVAVAAHVR